MVSGRGRGSAMVGQLVIQREQKREKKLSLSACITDSPFCREVEQFSPFPPLCHPCLEIPPVLFFFFFKPLTSSFLQPEEQSEQLYPNTNGCFTSYPFKEGPTSTTGRIDGTTSYGGTGSVCMGHTWRQGWRQNVNILKINFLFSIKY